MLNKTILMGRLVRDPELRHTPSNIPVTSFTLAVARDIKKEGQPDTDFIDCVSWDKKADFTAKYFHKGQLVAVVGKLQTRKWTDKENKPRISYEVMVDEQHFAEKKSDNPAPPPQYGTGKPMSVTAPDVPETDAGFAEVANAGDELPF